MTKRQALDTAHKRGWREPWVEQRPKLVYRDGTSAPTHHVGGTGYLRMVYGSGSSWEEAFEVATKAGYR